MHTQYGQKLNNYSAQVKRQKRQIEELNQRISELTLTKQKAVLEATSEAKRKVSDLQSDH